MSHGRPLSLTDRQLAELLSAAARLAPRWRHTLLSNFADAMTLRDEIEDAKVQPVLNELVDRLSGRVAA